MKLVDVRCIAVPHKRMRRLRPDVVDDLAVSISTQGLLQPIVVRHSNSGLMLVAGLHRLAAVKQLRHHDIRALILDGLNTDQALIAEIDENLVRADLSPAERALHLGERKRLYEKVHPQTRLGGDRKSAKAKSGRQNGELKKRFTEDAAEKTGSSERTVQREVERAARIDDLADVPGTSLDSPDELDALAKLPPTVQRDLIARAKAGEDVTARHVAKKLRRDGRERELAAATEAASRTLGTKLYGVIYADPPWRFDPYNVETSNCMPENHYETMPLAEIEAFAVPAAPNCVLFLWATVPMLPQALQVMAAWGFTYKSASTWVKDKAGTGYWVRGIVEHLLIGMRGDDVPAPAPGDQFPGVIEAPRGRHSEKPDVFAGHIVRLFPTVPRLEMFARKARPGWDVHGNEAPLGAALDLIDDRRAV